MNPPGTLKSVPKYLFFQIFIIYFLPRKRTLDENKIINY